MEDNKNGLFRKKKVYFSQVSNDALRDNLLSLKAKGLYALIQSYITLENFTLYKNKLKKECYEGNKAFEAAWKELKDKGYLVQHRMKSTSGTFYYEYELSDQTSLTQEERDRIPKKGGMDNNKNHAPKKDSMDKVPSGKRGIYNNNDFNNTNLNNTNLVVVVEAYTNAKGKSITKAEKDKLIELSNNYSEELILKAIDMTLEQANNVNIKYIRTILESFKAKGINTLEDIKVSSMKPIEAKKPKRKNSVSKNTWNNYENKRSIEDYIKPVEVIEDEEDANIKVKDMVRNMREGKVEV